MAFSPYHNILGSNGIDQVLVETGEGPSGLKSITITNVHASTDATVDLYIENTTTGAEKYYFIKSLTVDEEATYTLDLPYFNNKIYSLGITVGASDTVDVIIS